MGVTHAAAVRTGIANFVVDQLDEGTPPGKLVFRTAGDVAVATLLFASPNAFGNALAGVADANAISPDTNAAGGTVAKATLENAAGTAKLSCSVTTVGMGGDIELSAVVVTAGQTVSMSDLSYESPV